MTSQQPAILQGAPTRKAFALDDKNGRKLFSHHSWRKEFFYFLRSIQIS
jgi:hypothetical protein